MHDRELFEKAFSPLHASPDTLTEVRKTMRNEKKTRRALGKSAVVAIAAALVGAIVGELPAGATAGLGARLLSGSYYGQTVQIWAALFTAATLAAGLVLIVTWIERITLKRMGLAR